MADRDAGKPINQAIVQRLQVRNAGPHLGVCTCVKLDAAVTELDPGLGW